LDSRLKLNKLILFFALLFAFLNSSAQKFVLLKLVNEKNEPISYFNVVNATTFEKFTADKQGLAQVPNVESVWFKIQALGYADTVITFKANLKELVLIRNTGLLLKEVVITNTVYSKSITEFSTPSRRSLISVFPAFNKFTHQVIRVFDFNKPILLSRVSFAAKSKFVLDYPNMVRLNIYRVGEAMAKDLDDINKNKEKGFYSVSPPGELVFTGGKDELAISFANEMLTFDFLKNSIQLAPDRYLVSMELAKGKYAGFYNLFSQDIDCEGLMSNTDTAEVGWGTEKAQNHNRYLNPIVKLSYYTAITK
jgi:hypothetical protein